MASGDPLRGRHAATSSNGTCELGYRQPQGSRCGARTVTNAGAYRPQPAPVSLPASAFGEERGDRGGELGRGERAAMIAWHADEPGIAQERGQLAGVRALILVTDRNERRNRDLAQRVLGRWDK